MQTKTSQMDMLLTGQQTLIVSSLNPRPLPKKLGGTPVIGGNSQLQPQVQGRVDQINREYQEELQTLRVRNYDLLAVMAASVNL